MRVKIIVNIQMITMKLNSQNPHKKKNLQLPREAKKEEESNQMLNRQKLRKFKSKQFYFQMNLSTKLIPLRIFIEAT